MINNIVKQVLSYKKAQFEAIMSNARSFVAQTAGEPSSFLQQLENEQAAATQESSSVKQVGDQLAATITNNEWARRFSSIIEPANKSSAATGSNDAWNIMGNYTVQPIQAKYKGAYIDIIEEMSRKYKVPAALIQKIIETESNFNPKAVSSAGAKGLMQLMPANLQAHGVTNAYDPRQNIEAGVQELSGHLSRYHGDLVMALAAYNAGPGNVKKYGGVPPFGETRRYIQKILNVNVG